MSTITVRSPLPEGIEEYEGRWVAIRGDEVVAAADSLDELTNDNLVQPTDALYLVPERGTYFL